MRRNYQLTPLLGARRLAIPGELLGTRDERVELDEILVLPGAGGEPAMMQADGRGVGLFYAGCVRDWWLPPVVRVLCALSATPCDEVTDRFAAIYDVIDRTLLRQGIAPPPSRPRLICGDVILQRRRWTVGTESLPSRRSGESAGELLVRIDQWRRAAGLPLRAFCRRLGTRRRSDGATPRPGLYVDWSRPEIVSGLARTLRLEPGANEVIVAEEALPDHAAPARDGGPAHAIETLVELVGG
jgi:hypothetical protein